MQRVRWLLAFVGRLVWAVAAPAAVMLALPAVLLLAAVPVVWLMLTVPWLLWSALGVFLVFHVGLIVWDTMRARKRRRDRENDPAAW